MCLSGYLSNALGRACLMLLIGILVHGLCHGQSLDIQPPQLTERQPPLTDFPVKQTLRLVEHGVLPNTGQDALPAVRQVIAKVLKQNMATKLVFEPGNYRFSSMKWREYAIQLNGAKDLIIDGQGAAITMTNPECGVFQISQSQRVIIKNFSVDYDPLPYTQATVTAFDLDNRWFEIKVDAGFPLPSEPFFKTARRSWGALKDPNVPARLKDLSEGGHVMVQQWDDLGDRRFRLHAQKTAIYNHMAIGDKYIHLARTSIAQHFHADECTDLTALNLTVYASPASSFAANSCDRFSVIGCQIRIKPGRWHSSNGDGIHCQRNRTGPWIENCLIEGIIDDPTNIYSMRSELIEQVDEHTLKIKAKKPRTFKTPDAIGKPLILLNNRTGQIISSCTIKRIVDQDQTVLVQVTEPLPQNLHITDSFDSDVAFVGYNLSRDFVIRNNTYRLSQRHLIIMGGQGLIQGNTFDQISGPGVSILNHNRSRNEPESLLTGDLIIRDNTFVNCDFGPFAYHPKQAYGCLFLGSKTWDQKPGEQQLIGRVLIENNTFKNIRKAGINLNSAHDVLITGNRFLSDAQTPLDPDTSHAAIMMDNVSRVKITHNQLQDSRKLTLIQKTQSVTDMQLHDNKVNQP
ncbi:MAG: hypothetical protein CMJ19_14065 [Phycisphaeraceae bacterium]|nr:hypothetical protein [Phycisphaeraceae bacterium]